MRGRIKRAAAKSFRVPVIGKVKCGETVKAKTRQGKEYDRPVSLDYFRPSGKYASYFHDALGEKPSSIQVAFISSDPEEVCDERYELRDGQGRLYAKGDGATFHVWDGQAYAQYSAEDHPDLMDRAAKKAGGEWKVILELRFIIPAIRGVIGQWQLTTAGSASSIPNIRDTFDFVLETAGTVINVPFDLAVEKHTSQKPDAKSSYPVITLVPNVSTGHLETLRGFLESGHTVRELPGLLTEDRIEQLAPRQLGPAQDVEYEPAYVAIDPDEFPPAEEVFPE